MFKHYKIKKLISVYIDGEVSEEEKKFIEKHLKVCSSCRKYLEDLKRINSFLKTWEDESISPDLEQKIKMNFLNNKNKEVRKMKSKKILIGSTGILVVLLLTLIGINMFVNIEDKQKTSDLILTKIPTSDSLFKEKLQDTYGGIKTTPILFKEDYEKRYSLGYSVKIGRSFGSSNNIASLFSTASHIPKKISLLKKQRREEKVKAPLKEEVKPPTSEGEGSIVIVEPYLPATGEEEKIILNAEIEVEVKDVEKTYDKIIEVIKEEEGYLGGAHFEKKKTGKIEAKVILRIPKGSFEKTLVKIRKLGKVEKFDIQSIDISEEYATLVSELNTLKIIYDKIVEGLKQKRTDIEGAIRLESELTPIAKRIAQIREQLSRYDNLIKMSTITVYLTSFSWKILWRENIRSFMPLILILLILLLVTYIVVLSILRKIKK
jgi:hypothetical protein